MSKGLMLFFLSVLPFVSIKSQNIIIKSFIKDKESNHIVPFCTIQLLGTNSAMDANENGYFETSAKKSDTLIFSCIGYVDLKLSTLDVPDTIYLKPTVITLHQIVVSKRVNQTYGIVKEKKDRSSAGSAPGIRREFATLIEIPANIGLFKIAKVFVSGKDFKEESPIRLYIYEVDTNGLPGKELLTKEILLKNRDTQKKIVTIDLKDQEIYLENTSFFVGVQWITSAKDFTVPEIFETFKVKKLLTYRRSQTNNKNKWFGEFKKDFIFFPGGAIPENDTPINVLASAEIEVYQ